MKRIVVLVSGGGTNLQALIDAQGSIITNAKIVGVISSNSDAYAIKRAEKAGIPTRIIGKTDGEILTAIDYFNPDLVVLAGFLSILKSDVIKAYQNKIINIHPSLIPSFCGKGHYGLNVHKAALDYGVKITGATVHYVNEVIDGGGIIMQKAVNVLENDTPEALQKRVMEQAEWDILPKAVNNLTKEQ